ncbi:MAG: nucleotide sugar dehydrogenase [Chloroflexi bacterium]|nr:nucleotide sugar dehydrogenase [Chloroflexota bacterium]
MSLTDLRRKIEEKSANLAVIGLGYVGFPVACEFARAGFDVVGVDLLPERAAKINAGISPIEGDEPGLQELAEQAIATGRLRAMLDYQALTDRDVFIICVETPVDDQHIPQYRALQAALRSLSKVMKPGALVIVESTIAPRTMDELVKPLLEEASGRKVNEGFTLGNCPERVMPGKLLANIRSLSRVVGGMSAETAETMAALYRHIVHGELDLADCITAELVKTVENAYRDVQIAFANEVALICERAGGDVWKVRELVNKSPGRNMLLPGAGVGGHCIPKDPWLLAYSVHGDDLPLRVIPAARAVNSAMPEHMAELLAEALGSAGAQLKGARVLVMGYAYLEDSDDTRNSPSQALVEKLIKSGAEVVIHDPYVEPYRSDLLESAQGCDAAVVMVRHQEYLRLNLRALRGALRRGILVDGRGAYTAERAGEADFVYRLVGVADHRL